MVPQTTLSIGLPSPISGNRRHRPRRPGRSSSSPGFPRSMQAKRWKLKREGPIKPSRQKSADRRGVLPKATAV